MKSFTWKPSFQNFFHSIVSGGKFCHSRHINASLLPQNAHIALPSTSKQGGYWVGHKQSWCTQWNIDLLTCSYGGVAEMEKEEGLSMRNHSLQACGNGPRPVYQEQQGPPTLLRRPLPAAAAEKRNTIRKVWHSPPWILKTLRGWQGITRPLWDRELQRCHVSPCSEFLFGTGPRLIPSVKEESSSHPGAPGWVGYWQGGLLLKGHVFASCLR